MTFNPQPKPTPKAKKPGAMRSAPKVPAEVTAAVQEKHLAGMTARAAVRKDQAALNKRASDAVAAAPLTATVKGDDITVKGVAPAKPKKPSTAKPTPPAGGSKSDMLLGMLRKPGGASSKEMEAATGWAPHSVRGFLGTQRKAGVNVVSKKFGKGEPTVYSIEAQATPTEPVGDVV